MVSLTAIFVWRLSPFLVFGPWLVIACFDGTFLSSALNKVPHGAWFTIMLATILAAIFLIWRYGKEQQWSVEAEDRFPTSHFVRIDSSGGGGPHHDDHQMYLTPRFHGDPISPIKGFGIFFDKAGETTPTVFSQFATKLTAMPEIIVFFHLRSLEIPSVALEDRYTVSRLAIPHCYRLVVRYGFNDVVISPDLAAVVYEQIRQYKISEHRHKTIDLQDDNDAATTVNTHARLATAIDDHNNITLPPDPKSTADLTPTSNPTNPNSTPKSPHQTTPDLTRLDAAYAHKVLYIIGKQQMRIKPHRNLLLGLFLWMRENTRTKMSNLKVPIDRVIEVGFLKEI